MRENRPWRSPVAVGGGASCPASGEHRPAAAVRFRTRQATPGWLLGILLTLIGSMLVLSAGPFAVTAQETDAPATCEIPAPTLPLAPVEFLVATPLASPLVSPTAARAATPSPVASPAAQAEPDQFAGSGLAFDLARTARAFAACLSEGTSTTMTDLVTERYLGALYGGGIDLPRADFLLLAEALPVVPVEIQMVTSARWEPDGASAEVTYTVANQLLRGRWGFVREVSGDGSAGAGEQPWLIDSETALEVDPPAGAASIAINITEYAYALTPATVTGPDLVLRADNNGAEDHELLILLFAPSVTTDALLLQPGPALPDGVSNIGQLIVPAGAKADLTLVGLAPGTYTIVDLLPAADGTPHLALGETATFRVR